MLMSLSFIACWTIRQLLWIEPLTCLISTTVELWYDISFFTQFRYMSIKYLFRKAWPSVYYHNEIQNTYFIFWLHLFEFAVSSIVSSFQYMNNSNTFQSKTYLEMLDPSFNIIMRSKIHTSYSDFISSNLLYLLSSLYFNI